jgi:heparinase II/III-like protein/uncharacterized protein DUF4962
VSTGGTDWMTVKEPLAQAIRPADCAVVQQTPPDFSWPESASGARYELTLAYPDGRKRTLSAPLNYLNWDEALPPGTYAWQVKANGEASRARRFTVDATALPFVVPPTEELLRRVKAKPRPRSLPDAATLRAMSAQRAGALAQLRREVDGKLRNPLPSEPNTGSTGANDARVFDEAKRTLNSLQAYTLLRDDKYYEDAVRRLRNMASWDPSGRTSFNAPGMDRSARFLTWMLVIGYDWLQPRLDAGTKSQLLATLRVRLGQMYGDVAGARPRIARQPRDSHGINALSMLAVMSVIVAGDIAEADSWVAGTLPLALNLMSPWAGEESGFANGSAYGTWAMGDTLLYWYALRHATGIDVAQKAWMRNWGRFMAYFDPPGSPARLFGDGHESSMFDEHKARYGKGYAHFAPTPLARWWASRITGEDAMRAEYLLSPPAPFSGPQPLPAGTPNSLYLPSTGWVAMHSALADEKRVSLYFKSAPPPYGAFNHSHADNNSFVVNAGGQRLAIESGYYDSYKSAHWRNWLHQTRAKNAITYDGGKGQLYFEQDNKMGYGAITRYGTDGDAELVTGDATQAYGGALKQALRTMVYLRPNLIVVYDKLASATPRQWEWNIHALNKIDVASDRKIRIANNGQSLCVEMLAAPEMRFTQSDEWSAPPARGAPQWHGRFSTQPLAAAEFIALLNVGCTDVAVRTTKDGAAWRLTVDKKEIRLESP